MVKVHVWLPDSAHVGHAALTIGTVYVSFWPQTEANKKDLKIKRSQPGAFNASLHDDIRSEGDRQPVTVTIANRVDEDALLDHIAELQRTMPRYQLARNNCSHVVAECLYAACGVKPSFVPNAGAYGRAGKLLGRGIWTPDQILKYAQELAT